MRSPSSSSYIMLNFTFDLRDRWSFLGVVFVGLILDT